MESRRNGPQLSSRHDDDDDDDEGLEYLHAAFENDQSGRVITGR